MMLDPKESVNLKRRVQSVDIVNDMILVATANLGGNTWDATLLVVDYSTKEVVATVKQPCGCADVCWTSLGQRAICAEDSGDVKRPTSKLLADKLQVMRNVGCPFEMRNGLAAPLSVYKMDEEAPVRLVKIASLEEHDDIVSTVAASDFHNGFVLSGSYDRSVSVWDIDSGRHTSLNTFTGHSGSVTGAEWSGGEDCGQVFASSSTDRSVRLWDRRQARGCCACLRLGAPALSVSWDTCSQDLIGVGCEDGTVAILDKRTFSSPISVQQTHAGRVNRTTFGPATAGDVTGQEFSLLASVGDDGVVAVRRLGEDSYIVRSKLHSDYAQGLTWRDENTVISGGWDSELCFGDLKQHMRDENMS